MQVRLLSLVTVFSFVATAAHPYTKADLKNVGNVAVVGAVLPTIGKVIAGNDSFTADMQRVGMLSNEVYAVVCSALEDGTLLMNLRSVLDKALDGKKDGILSKWSGDNAKAVSVATVVAVTEELSHYLTAKLARKFVGRADQRVIRRAVRVAADTLVDGIITLVADWSINKINNNSETSCNVMQKCLTKMASSFATNTAYEVAGELLLLGASDYVAAAEVAVEAAPAPEARSVKIK